MSSRFTATMIRVRRICVLLALAVATALLSGMPSYAQTFCYKQSVDAFVADSETVVVGQVIGTSADRHDVYGRNMHPVVIAVKETLRGKPGAELQADLLFENSDCNGDRAITTANINDWVADKTHLLVAFEREEQRAGSPPLARVINLEDKHIEIWRADFILLATREGVLQAARDEAKRLSGTGQRVDIVQMDWAKGSCTGMDSSLGLSVPADDRMAARAAAVIRGEIEGCYGTASKTRAAQVLGHFRPKP